MSSIKLPSFLPPERSRARDNERNEELETPHYSNLNESTDEYVWFSEYLTSDDSSKSNSEASSSSLSFNTSYSGNTRGGGGVEKEGESGEFEGGDLVESESPFYSDMDFPSTTTTQATEVPDGFMYTHRGFLIPCSLKRYRNLYPSISPTDYLKIARSYLEIERSGGIGKEYEYEFLMAMMRKGYLDAMDQCSEAMSKLKKGMEMGADAKRLKELGEEYERWKQVVDNYRETSKKK
ncbi:hypothetical protein C8Q75DRAFT_811884 [Abortiporus biennis]|nr:hypothetical protein C8Q75DRAFT_811884 [Abortiporus biennis]